MSRPTLRALLLMALFASQAVFAADTVVVVVRHAEKAHDDPRDPSLSALGRARADDLAEALKGSRLSAVYASQFRRTQLTGQPSAEHCGLSVQVLPLSADKMTRYGDDFAARVRAEHAGQTVLIVGHSNTVPDLVEALSGQAAEPMPESEFDRFTVVILPEQGPPRVIVSRY